MSDRRSWRLATRITRWCMGIGTGFVTVLALAGGILVHVETRHELDAIASEETMEMVEAFQDSDRRPEDFVACADELQRSHPDDGMAWRVWRRGDGEEWAAFGQPGLLALIPSEPGTTPALTRIQRWRSGELDEEFSFGMVLEGGHEVAAERLFWVIAGSTIVLAAAGSFLAGRLFGNRIGGWLRAIASETRKDAPSSAQSAGQSALPEEIEDVVLALREALARIRTESDRARLLASGLAHELRSPLQNLLMRIEVVQLRERAPAEYRTALSGLLTDLQELIRAVDNLVILCAPPEARRSRQTESFDLAQEARLRLKSDVARAALSDVSVRIHLPESLPLRGDRETLMLALRNLVANAIDWSPPRGVVDVRSRAEPERVTIEVEDQGPGVADADREHIFQPFQHGGPRPNGSIGYGLGLALVRTTAEMHDGHVHVERSAAGGARFVLAVPR